MEMVRYRSILCVLLLLTIIGIFLMSCSNRDKNTTGKVYKGISQGYGGEITVYVTITETGVIEAIRVKAPKEDPNIGIPATKTLARTIIKDQSINVDAITGATITSNGFLEATQNALTKGGFDLTNFK